MMFKLNVIMATDVITVSLSTTLAEARSVMKEHRISICPS